MSGHWPLALKLLQAWSWHLNSWHNMMVKIQIRASFLQLCGQENDSISASTKRSNMLSIELVWVVLYQSGSQVVLIKHENIWHFIYIVALYFNIPPLLDLNPKAYWWKINPTLWFQELLILNFFDSNSSLLGPTIKLLDYKCFLLTNHFNFWIQKVYCWKTTPTFGFKKFIAVKPLQLLDSKSLLL